MATSRVVLGDVESATGENYRARFAAAPERQSSMTTNGAIDKITAIPVAKIGGVIGEADDALLLRVNRALALFLSIV